VVDLRTHQRSPFGSHEHPSSYPRLPSVASALGWWGGRPRRRARVRCRGV